MIHVLPRCLTDEQLQRITSISGSSHHDDDGGHVSNRKPHRLVWLANLLMREVSHLPITDMVGVDPNMKVYRLLGSASSVPLHTDEDFPGECGAVARYSLLLRLNGGYKGGETSFPGVHLPFIPIGGGVVFKHDIPHQGFPVISGEKLVLKTDIFSRN